MQWNLHNCCKAGGKTEGWEEASLSHYGLRNERGNSQSSLGVADGND